MDLVLLHSKIDELKQKLKEEQAEINDVLSSLEQNKGQLQNLKLSYNDHLATLTDFSEVASQLLENKLMAESNIVIEEIELSEDTEEEQNENVSVDTTINASKENLVIDTEEPNSLNEQFSNTRNSVGENLNTPEELIKSIGINDRFAFVKNLFQGDSSAFEKAINEIQAKTSVSDTEDYLNANLIQTLNWDTEDELVIQFTSLVKRRFTAKA